MLFRSEFPVEGEKVYLSDVYWGNSIRWWDYATVTTIDWRKSIITIFHNPVDGSIVENPAGIIQISVDNDSITQTLTPVLDKTVYTNDGEYITIVEYDDQNIKVAHTLAGKTLIFQIKLEKIF